MNNERLIYVPFGGAGEIGMNFYAYGWGEPEKEQFIIVDMGITFPTMETTPGVDVIMASPEWLYQQGERVKAIFITHAHEDHIGAIGILHDRFPVPIYARKFTAEVAKAKLSDWSRDLSHIVTVAPYPETVTAGAFQVNFLPVSHSIPEASALIIDTPLHRVIHTGDLKLDKTPIIGDPYDEALFKDVASTPIRALMCDSTNVFSKDVGRSEADLKQPFVELIESAQGMVVATSFASNIARLKNLAEAAQEAERSICVLGRSMQRMLEYARVSGVLGDFPSLVPLEDAKLIPRANLMLIVTGSQGERRAASAQLANGKYLGFDMRKGDMFLFSSKTIPGNEIAVGRVVNALVEQGVRVIDEDMGFYHVSGHANKPDLERLHALFNADYVIPMHGEAKHLYEHKRLVEDNGGKSLVAQNGAIVNLTAEPIRIEDHIEANRLYLEGTEFIGARDGIVRDRIKLAMRGIVVASLILEDNQLTSVWVEVLGVADPSKAQMSLAELIENEIEAEISRMSPKNIRQDAYVIERVENRISFMCREWIGKKPVSRVILERLEFEE